jgi:hypothetical protein
VPVAIACLVLAVVLGLFAPRRIALILTAAAAAITVLVFIWAVADGKGDDPWWLIPIGTAVGGVALAACAALSARRVQHPARG